MTQITTYTCDLCGKSTQNSDVMHEFRIMIRHKSFSKDSETSKAFHACKACVNNDHLGFAKHCPEYRSALWESIGKISVEESAREIVNLNGY